MVNTDEGGADMAQGTCSVGGCEREARARGWCYRHYQRWRKYGDPSVPVPDVLRGSTVTLRDLFAARLVVGQPDECWEWTYLNGSRGSNRYGRVKKDGHEYEMHRLAWEFANGPIPDGLWVLHRCDNMRCCNPAHLFLGTHEDNMADMRRKGRAKGAPTGAKNGQNLHPERRPRGERNGQAKLTDQQVAAIRSAHADGARVTALARKYGVAHSQVSRIVHGLRRAA